MAKKRKLAHHGLRPSGHPRAKLKSQQAKGQKAASSTPAATATTVPAKHQAHHAPPPAPTIPFASEDAILLVGEGDLSFSASLVEHHGCSNVTATVLERNLEELMEKYPHAGENASKISASDGKVVYGIDARKMTAWTRKSRTADDREPTGMMDRIIFNFPHVGGKSTDVNRQVRHNQELLVDFFRRALLSLAPGGCIVVTLFEGEPYTLWNVRDLARHAGLQVERSFRFQAEAYPGYRHARTLGVIRNRRGEAGGGWKGEERPARSYVFVRKGDVAELPSAVKKRRRQDDSSEDEEDD